MKELPQPGACPRCETPAWSVRSHFGTCPNCGLVIEQRSLFDVHPNLAFTGSVGLLALMGALGTVAIRPGLTILFLLVGLPFFIFSFRRMLKHIQEGRRLTPLEMVYMSMSGLGAMVALLLAVVVVGFLLFWMACMALMAGDSVDNGIGGAICAFVCPIAMLGLFIAAATGVTWKK